MPLRGQEFAGMVAELAGTEIGTWNKIGSARVA